MLELPIKKKWFDMIRSGEKKEEYREIKPYWTSRFLNLFEREKYSHYEKNQYLVAFRNGYSANSPSIKCLCTISKGYGKEEWGAEPGKEYYVLEILEVHDE